MHQHTVQATWYNRSTNQAAGPEWVSPWQQEVNILNTGVTVTA
jgi:hypothetical protein